MTMDRAGSIALNTVTPMSPQTTAEAIKQDGAVGGALSTLGYLGTGVSSYGGTIAKLQRDWLKDYDTYNNLPKNSIDLQIARQSNKNVLSREDYRKLNPTIDARLFLTGETQSVSTYRSALETYNLIQSEGLELKDIKGVQKTIANNALISKAGLTDENITATELLVQVLNGTADEQKKALYELNARSQAENIKAGITNSSFVSILNKATDQSIKSGKFDVKQLEYIKQVMTPYYAIPGSAETSQYVWSKYPAEYEILGKQMRAYLKTGNNSAAYEIYRKNPQILEAIKLEDTILLNTGRARDNMKKQNPVIAAMLKMYQ